MMTDKIPFEAFVSTSKLSLSPSARIIGDNTLHDIFVIEVCALMQAARKITINAIKHVVEQIFLRCIQLGSMMKGSSSSYVRLVVISLLKVKKKIVLN